MAEITVYGASDDLIEIEGAIREEFNYQEGETNYVAFSDGSLLTIKYGDEGIWRIALVSKKGTTEYSITQGTDVDDDYTDRAVLTNEEGFAWAVHGINYVKN